MKSLTVLQEGVLKDDKSIVSGYMDELDLKTGNERMIKAGEKFGFKTIEVYGKLYAWSAEISRVHGYARPEYISRLLRKWEIQAPSIGWFPREWGTRIRRALGINEKDSRAILIDWNGFLLAGVKGEGENADQVLAYLLECERQARMGAETIDQAKARDLTMKEEIHRLKIWKEKHSMIKMTGAAMPQSMKAEYQAITGTMFPDDKQLDFTKEEKTG